MSVAAIENGSDLDLRLEEKALVERMLAGDEPAMEEFADGYFPGLYRFALARLHGDSELTRELVQTTVCKALAKLETYRGEAPLFTWLCACCRNEIRMHFRQKKRLPRIVELDADAPEADRAAGLEWGEHPEGALARKEEVHRVHEALDLLPPHYARALEWKYVDRLPVKEIAERLRLGAKAAESLLTRARQAFREGYERASHRSGTVVAWSRPKGS
jgi:RNA polymerase sigma-70 factor (ECF subfamily)